MKTKLVLSVFLTAFLFLGCSNNDENSDNSETVSKTTSSSMESYAARGSSVTTQEFPQAQQEVTETLGAITQSIIDGDLDLLISFHAYGPKFTEFKDGAQRNGAIENELHERFVFNPETTEVIKMDALGLKVAVYYGNVAVVTFHSDFELRFGEDPVTEINNQITLVFVKTRGEWKIVHEHHSPWLETSGLLLNE